MTEKTFNLPDVGEGLTEADIVQWKVQPGDTVAVNDVIVEIETAKSLVELPSPYAGTVSALMVAEGETVDVGTPIISVAVGGGPRAEATTPAPQAAPPQAAAPGLFIDECGNAAIHRHLSPLQGEIFQLQSLAVDCEQTQSGFQDDGVLIETDHLRHPGHDHVLPLRQRQLVGQYHRLCHTHPSLLPKSMPHPKRI